MISKTSRPHIQWAIALSFTICTLLALASESNPFHILYGIPFTLTSLFVLLNLRSCGFWPGVLTAAIVHSIGAFVLDLPFVIYIGLIEVICVGILLRSRRKRLFVSDVFFWLFVGMPIIYFIYSLNDGFLPAEGLIFATIAAVNGLFNSFLAEVIYQYIPVGKRDSTNRCERPPHSIRQVFFHLSIGVVLLSFLFNLFMNSFGSIKDFSLYAQQLASYEAKRIINELDKSEDMPFSHTKEARLQQIDKIVKDHSPKVTINVMDSSNIVISSSNDSNVGLPQRADAQGKTIAVHDQLDLFVPKMAANSLQYQSWLSSHFIYKDTLSQSDWTIIINIPVNYYQNYLLKSYYNHLIYALAFAALVIAICCLINRWLTRSLTQLALASSNLPIKLKQMRQVEWPNTNVVEIHSLISNFKHMSSNLLFMFQESKKFNERLEAQAFMLQQSEERLHQLAYYDSLTGLPNRLEFMQYFQQIIGMHAASNRPIAVMIADINRFKQINDTLGLAVGDSLLQQASQRFGNSSMKELNVFRSNGDDFLFIAPYKDMFDIHKGAQSIIHAFAEPFIINNSPIFLTVSVGVSVYPFDGKDIDTIIRNAGIAMETAKAEGDGCYRFFQPKLESIMTERMQIENGLYNALLNNQFALHYQPKMTAGTGELCGIEALIRWTHPELGMIPPDKFIPLAEQSGFILEIDNWVFREACRQNKAWQDAGLQQICVSVNISARHFFQGNLRQMVVDALHDTGLDPKYISIEITEGVFMQNIDQVIETISYLRSLGIQLSIDDFGTGFSSLNQLQRLPISDVKLDRSFIQGITNDDKKSSIVRAIIELVHSMNMRVIAEGVETLDESRFCTELKCDELQGYYYSRPLPADRLEELLRPVG